MKVPLIIGIAGGSGSGKTRFIDQLKASLNENELTILSMDNYYKPIDQQPRDINDIENFDLPESLDIDRFYQDFTSLREGNPIKIMSYTFNNKDIEPQEIDLIPSKILIVEGIFCFHFDKVNRLLNLRLFMETPDYLMLSRRIIRDAQERGYEMDDVLYRFKHHVVPAYNQYIAPLKLNADIIIPNQTDFSSALEVLLNHIKFHLKEN